MRWSNFPSWEIRIGLNVYEDASLTIVDQEVQIAWII